MATIKSLRLTFRALALRLSFWRILNYPVILSHHHNFYRNLPLYSFNFTNSSKLTPTFDERVINIMENLTEVLPTGFISFFSKTTTRWVHWHRQSGSGLWICFYRMITMGVLQLKISRSWILVYLMKFSWSLHDRSRKNGKRTMFFNQTNIKFTGQGLK